MHGKLPLKTPWAGPCVTAASCSSPTLYTLINDGAARSHPGLRVPWLLLEFTELPFDGLQRLLYTRPRPRTWVAAGASRSRSRWRDRPVWRHASRRSRMGGRHGRRSVVAVCKWPWGCTGGTCLGRHEMHPLGGCMSRLYKHGPWRHGRGVAVRILAAICGGLCGAWTMSGAYTGPGCGLPGAITWGSHGDGGNVGEESRVLVRLVRLQGPLCSRRGCSSVCCCLHRLQQRLDQILSRFSSPGLWMVDADVHGLLCASLWPRTSPSQFDRSPGLTLDVGDV